MVRADATAEQPRRLRDLGARAYLSKPLKVAALVQMIDETLARVANQPMHKG